MAGYQEQRGQNYEIKYLRKVLGEVDESIPIPDSVRGDALRHKLDNIYPTTPAAPNKKSGTTFGLRWFSLHSGIGYAAAFALIVGLFYGLGFNQQPEMNIVEHNMALSSTESSDTPGSVKGAEGTAPFSADESAPSLIDSHVSANSAADGTPAGSPSGSEPAGGVGGGGKSVVLGSQSGYTYTWRNNDATDPDKGAFPITLDIVRDSDAVLAAQIDIPDIQTITASYFNATTVTVVGTGEEGIITRSYAIGVPQEPQELATTVQSGVYVDSRLYENVIHTVSYCEDSALLQGDIEELPYALHQNACVISALDTATGETAQKTFTGADPDISLRNLSAFISYYGTPIPPETSEAPESTEANAPEPEQSDIAPAIPSLHIAQIRLDKTSITYVE